MISQALILCLDKSQLRKIAQIHPKSTFRTSRIVKLSIFDTEDSSKLHILPPELLYLGSKLELCT